MDFTLTKYKELILHLSQKGYSFKTFGEYIRNPEARTVILRHDVDKKKENSLAFAKIQHELNIKGTYYFRIVPESWDEKIIREIAGMGHEVGYHYEDMDMADGDVNEAIRLFKKNLERLRTICPVETVCMHGSPRSKHDNRSLWESFSYRDFGITGEPYFDVDFNKMLYLTDTGRRWNGGKFSIRDKVSSHWNYSFRSTGDIIREMNVNGLPDQIMFTFHPQRWTNNPVDWSYELLWQNFKNIIKAAINIRKN